LPHVSNRRPFPPFRNQSRRRVWTTGTARHGTEEIEERDGSFAVLRQLFRQREDCWDDDEAPEATVLCRVLLSLCIKCSREGGQTSVGAPDSDVPRPVWRARLRCSQAKPSQARWMRWRIRDKHSTRWWRARAGGGRIPASAGSRRWPAPNGMRRSSRGRPAGQC
jgi:hypothetical protein